MGLERLAPTHDLNAAQIAALARETGANRIEAIAYQHLPVFHTEHCVFCRFLSKGTSYRDCGRPCEKHTVALRDEGGRAHPVLADVGCRNTVFGAEAQEASLHINAWLEAGIRHFRLEFARRAKSNSCHAGIRRSSWAQCRNLLRIARPRRGRHEQPFVPPAPLVASIAVAYLLTCRA
jgi:putative protease